MDGRITYLLLMFTFGRIVVQTVCSSREMFTCGKSVHCTIVVTEEKVWPLNFQLHSFVKVKKKNASTKKQLKLNNHARNVLFASGATNAMTNMFGRNMFP